MSTTDPRSRWLPALAFFGLLALPGSARAEFQITYTFTDADGKPMPELALTATDMAGYFNQASCRCGQVLGARVVLDDTTGDTFPADTEMRTYVGYNCDLGQNSIGQQNYPCVELHEGLASDYADDGLLLSFEQVWLSSRVQSIDTQTIETAEPRLPCSPEQVGGGGIWICAESNGEPGCQADEFVVKGDSSLNDDSDANDNPYVGGGGPITSIQFDHIPPQSVVDGFVAHPEDGSVLITWDRTEVPDISGFRVLCADTEGNPPKTVVTDVPTGTARTNGKLYYTAENLCPGAAVHEPEPIDDQVDSPLTTLDWGYVCSGHASYISTSIRVDGLENGEEYEFLVVAYDRAGNPRVMSDLLVAAPVSDGCACRTGEPTPRGTWLGAGLLLLGLTARRRPFHARR